MLWMSKRTSAILRDPKHLADIIALKNLRHPIYGFEISSLRFWKVCEFRDSVLIASIGTAQIHDAPDLGPVHRNFNANFFRLLELERALFERARRRRGGSGKKAIHQIERERQRLGRELHTGVGQLLAAIRWQLEVISTELPNPPAGVQQALDNISTLTAQTLEQVRSLSRRLHPPEWQRLSLETAIRQLWEISGIPQSLNATLTIDRVTTEPDLEVKILVYRAFQEALSNLARHSHATQVDVALHFDNSRLILRIKDNGVGFDVGRLLSAPANVASGIGLRSIREAVETLGGEFELESNHTGTKLTISVALFPTEDLEDSKE